METRVRPAHSPAHTRARLGLTHREEAGGAAAQARLPVDGVVVVLAAGQRVHSCYDNQVDAHAQVGEGQVAHEEARDRQLGAAPCGNRRG